MAKILIVEDEPQLRETIVEELNEEGHMTIEAGNGIEGLERLAVEAPDMIISDITMPQMNGYQFFRSVKEKHPEHGQTPFIFLTALADRDDELKGLRLGVDEYITKPIDFDLLLARVELALRRHQAQTISPPPQPQASPPAKTDPENNPQEQTQKLEAMARDGGGRIQTGKLETISLEEVREKVGDRWPEVSDSMMEGAKAAIEEHLGPRDFFRITPTRDFVVYFADLTMEEAAGRVSLIRDEIWERLFAETQDEGLSQVRGQAFELLLELDDADDIEIVVSDIDELVEEQIKEASDQSRKRLSQIYQYENLYALSMFSPNGTPSKIKMLSFEKKFSVEVSKLFDDGRYDSPFLLDLQQTLFERLKEKRVYKDAFSKAAMLLPVCFPMMSEKENRDGLINLCKDLESKMGVTLIPEITHTPDRIKPHIQALRPLPVGRQLQFLELRRTKQLDDLDVGQLSENGVAFVSMTYDQAMNHDKKDLLQATQKLKGIGVKLFLKDIPEGNLIKAQDHQAHLYAIRQ